MLLLAADTAAAAIRSNFRIGQDQMVTAVGAQADRLASAETAVADALRAYQRARVERRPVVLMLPLDIQAQPATFVDPLPERHEVRPTRSADASFQAAVDRLAGVQRPLIIAGRGARVSGAREPLE